MKSMIGLVVLGVCAYGVFFVELGDQTIAGHVLDIWRAPVVQTKLEGAREGVKRELEERLAEAGEQAGRRAAREITGPRDELTAEDRRGLEEVLVEVSQE